LRTDFKFTSDQERISFKFPYLFHILLYNRPHPPRLNGELGCSTSAAAAAEWCSTRFSAARAWLTDCKKIAIPLSRCCSAPCTRRHRSIPPVFLCNTLCMHLAQPVLDVLCTRSAALSHRAAPQYRCKCFKELPRLCSPCLNHIYVSFVFVRLANRLTRSVFLLQAADDVAAASAASV
jgi:hypothetical protein